MLVTDILQALKGQYNELWNAMYSYVRSEVGINFCKPYCQGQGGQLSPSPPPTRELRLTCIHLLTMLTASLLCYC